MLEGFLGVNIGRLIKMGKLRPRMGKGLKQVPQVRILKWPLMRFINENVGVLILIL